MTTFGSVEERDSQYPSPSRPVNSGGRTKDHGSAFIMKTETRYVRLMVAVPTPVMLSSVPWRVSTGVPRETSPEVSMTDDLSGCGAQIAQRTPSGAMTEREYLPSMVQATDAYAKPAPPAVRIPPARRRATCERNGISRDPREPVWIEIPT